MAGGYAVIRRGYILAKISRFLELKHGLPYLIHEHLRCKALRRNYQLANIHIFLVILTLISRVELLSGIICLMELYPNKYKMMIYRIK